MRIYVASSWKNPYHSLVVNDLRNAGHAIYDYRNPVNSEGFRWSDVDPGYKDWTPEHYRHILKTGEKTARGFLNDMKGLWWCEACLLVQPSGRSAHLELGWACGANKRTGMLLDHEQEFDLMPLMVDDIFISLREVIDHWRIK